MSKETIQVKKERLIRNQPTGIIHVLHTAGQLAEQGGLDLSNFYSAIRGVKQRDATTHILVDQFNPESIEVIKILRRALCSELESAKELVWSASTSYEACSGLAKMLSDGTEKRNLLDSTEILLS